MGKVDHVLSSLTHAYDTGGPEHLHLLVKNENDKNKGAKKLVEPRVKGAFECACFISYFSCAITLMMGRSIISNSLSFRDTLVYQALLGWIELHFQ